MKSLNILSHQSISRRYRPVLSSESGCNRKHFDEPVSIRTLERAASDYGSGARRIIGIDKTGKTAAIIGAGPAGLTCAYFLSLLGHEVTLFESLPVLGGMPRVAIPDGTLPKEIVDREVARIIELGVTVKINTSVGKDVLFEEVTGRYGACLVATGVRRPREQMSRTPDSEFFKRAIGLQVTSRGTLKVDPFTLATGRPGVFAAGDIVRGPRSVAEAVGSGRRAAFDSFTDEVPRGIKERCVSTKQESSCGKRSCKEWRALDIS